MAATAGWKVEVTGLRQVIDALGEVDKRAVKIITKEITDAGKRVVAAAASQSPTSGPVSNWGAWTYSRDGRDLGFAPSKVSSGFKLRRNNYRRRGVSAGIGWSVYQANPAGSIFEVMGSGSRVATPAGQRLVNLINARFPGKQPRTLLPAYYVGMPKNLRDDIRDLILVEARKAGLT